MRWIVFHIFNVIVCLPLVAFVVTNYVLWAIVGLMFWVSGVAADTMDDWDNWSRYGPPGRPLSARIENANRCLKLWFSQAP